MSYCVSRTLLRMRLTMDACRVFLTKALETQVYSIVYVSLHNCRWGCLLRQVKKLLLCNYVSILSYLEFNCQGECWWRPLNTNNTHTILFLLAPDRITVTFISPLQLFESLRRKCFFFSPKRVIVCRCMYRHRMLTKYKKDSLDTWEKT